MSRADRLCDDFEVDREARAFERRAEPFAPDTKRPFIPATRRLAWAAQDDRTWEFNPREVRELKALIERLLDEVLAARLKEL